MSPGSAFPGTDRSPKNEGPGTGVLISSGVYSALKAALERNLPVTGSRGRVLLRFLFFGMNERLVFVLVVTAATSYALLTLQLLLP